MLSSLCKKFKVVIVNTGVSNVRSVQNMLKRLGVDSKISDEYIEIKNADILILPGVGSYDACITKFVSANIIDVLNYKVMGNTPMLGICLGMQIMGDKSEEGNALGLGWIPGELRLLKPSIDNDMKIRVPHMGWNIINNTESLMLYQDMGPKPRFYFDHSYYFIPRELKYSYGTSKHGIEFSVGIKKGNVFGVQFHPEKSHRFGLQLFKNFINYSIGCLNSDVLYKDSLNV